ncbi:hypothetical protein DXA91_01220 [Clostridium sp. OF09-10]|nr:hypothetical protein DXA91_01220 [Clostridium sp. OF09-10]
MNLQDPYPADKRGCCAQKCHGSPFDAMYPETAGDVFYKYDRQDSRMIRWDALTCLKLSHRKRRKSRRSECRKRISAQEK